jgi:chemotaxis protein methyltransferase CheR
MRATPPDWAERYFVPAGANRVRVRDDVKAWVTFGQHNLTDEAAGQLVPRTDVVFCRNVMIYFDQAARRRVLRVIRDRLCPGGYLLLGHAENLLSLGADFELVHLKGDLVYRRPDLPHGEAR